jgi:hypothetical protein
MGRSDSCLYVFSQIQQVDRGMGMGVGNAHGRVPLGNDAPEDAPVEILVFNGKEIAAVWCGEPEVEQPPRQVVAISVHKVPDRREIVHIQRAGEPRST